MVSHRVCDVLETYLAGRLHEEREALRGVVAHCIFNIVHCRAGHFLAVFIDEGEIAVAEAVEGGPGTALAAPHRPEIQRSIGVAEAEVGILSAVPAPFPCEADHVRGIDAVFRVVQREGADAGLVRVGADISVRHPACHPEQTFAVRPLAYEVHYPHFVLVGNGEGFAFRSIAVLVCQSGYEFYGLPCARTSLEGYVNEGTVIQDAVVLRQFVPASVGGLGYDELLLVEVAQSLEGPRSLPNLAEVTVGVPVVNLTHAAAAVLSALSEIQLSVELVRVGGV